MEKHHIAFGVVALLVLAGGVYQGCLAGAGESGSELAGGPTMPPTDEPPIIPGDAGPMAVVPPTVPSTNLPPGPGVPGRCGGLVCAAGERCCPSTGECHPIGCTDCCPMPVAAPDFPGYVPPDEEPGRPIPGAAGELPPPTMPTEGPGPGPDPPRP